jgi:dihydrodipicolinate synthase/N-acetylneuraminate lyase
MTWLIIMVVLGAYLVGVLVGVLVGRRSRHPMRPLDDEQRRQLVEWARREGTYL